MPVQRSSGGRAAGQVCCTLRVASSLPTAMNNTGGDSTVCTTCAGQALRGLLHSRAAPDKPVALAQVGHLLASLHEQHLRAQQAQQAQHAQQARHTQQAWLIECSCRHVQQPHCRQQATTACRAWQAQCTAARAAAPSTDKQQQTQPAALASLMPPGHSATDLHRAGRAGRAGRVGSRQGRQGRLCGEQAGSSAGSVGSRQGRLCGEQAGSSAGSLGSRQGRQCGEQAGQAGQAAAPAAWATCALRLSMQGMQLRSANCGLLACSAYKHPCATAALPAPSPRAPSLAQQRGKALARHRADAQPPPHVPHDRSPEGC